MLGLKAPSKDEHFIPPTDEHMHCNFSSSLWAECLEILCLEGTDLLSPLADEACFTLEEL